MRMKKTGAKENKEDNKEEGKQAAAPWRALRGFSTRRYRPFAGI